VATGSANWVGGLSTVNQLRRLVAIARVITQLLGDLRIARIIFAGNDYSTVLRDGLCARGPTSPRA
jgi:hypothetical protein